MLVALDLTARQAARVLTQAVRTHARLEIDPRSLFLDPPLGGTLESSDAAHLVVALTDGHERVTLATLVGAMCDVRTILSRQLYLFSTAILEANDGAAKRLRLAIPQSIQVANRRQFARRSPTEPVPVRLTVPGAAQPLVGQLTNISRNGLGCRGGRQELDGVLLIGDEIHTEFVLPWATQVFALPATVCTKTVCHDRSNLLVGLEFAAQAPATRATLELLRTALDSETRRLTEMDGDVL
jgi:hypothetical protein